MGSNTQTNRNTNNENTIQENTQNTHTKRDLHGIYYNIVHAIHSVTVHTNNALYTYVLHVAHRHRKEMSF